MPIAIRHITALPKKALRRPPALIGGGVSCVNSATLMPPRPLATNVHRIQPRDRRPSPAARHASTSDTALVTGRRRSSASAVRRAALCAHAALSCPPCVTELGEAQGRVSEGKYL